MSDLEYITKTFQTILFAQQQQLNRQMSAVLMKWLELFSKMSLEAMFSCHERFLGFLLCDSRTTTTIIQGIFDFESFFKNNLLKMAQQLF